MSRLYAVYTVNLSIRVDIWYLIFFFHLLFQIQAEEDDASDWEEGEATDEALEVPRRVPFPEFGGDIVHTSGKKNRSCTNVQIENISV